MPPTKDVTALALAFATSGTVHIGRPQVFLPTVPAWVPARRPVVVWSGVAELVCAAGLFVPRTRRSAGWASAALLVAVFPANIQMAVDAFAGPSTPRRVGTLARLPLQLPLIRIALRAARAVPALT